MLINDVEVKFMDFRGLQVGLPDVSLEVIQDQPGTIFQPSPDGGFHHIAYLVEDIDTASDQLRNAGWHVETVPVQDGKPSWVYLISPFGMRVEIEVAEC